ANPWRDESIEELEVPGLDGGAEDGLLAGEPGEEATLHALGREAFQARRRGAIRVGAGGADLEAERPAELIAERLLEGGAGGGVAELLETGAGWNLQDEEVRPGGVDACSLQEDGGSVGHASPLADEGFECGLRPAAALRCG